MATQGERITELEAKVAALEERLGSLASEVIAARNMGRYSVPAKRLRGEE